MRRATIAGIILLAALPAMAEDHVETTTRHGISAFGDLKYPAGFAHFDYVNPEAPQGGTMSFQGFLASRTFDSLNAFILKGEQAQGLERLYDTLMVRAFDEPDAVYGQIAESVEMPEDRTWAIFNLRPEARFSDGEPIEASDVVFTIDILKTEGHPYYGILLADVTGAEALGPHRVRVDFDPEAATRDLASEVAQIEILPEHYYAEVAFGESTLEPPVSSGEYRVADVDPGRTITYCKDPDYWGRDLAVNVGTDNFECYRYEYFADMTAGFEAFKAGEYLFHESFISAEWATAYDFPAVRNGWVIRDEIPDGRPSGAQGFYFNLRNEKFADPRLREAIGMMFNFEWTNATLFYGIYSRTDSFFEGSDLEATGLAEGAELAILEEVRGEVPESVFDAPAYSPPVSREVGTLDRGLLRQAGRLLDEAGWEVGDDGLRRNAAGEVLSLTLVDDSPSFTRIILPFIENLQRLGIDARHELIDAAQYNERREVFDYEMTPSRIVFEATPSVSLRTVFGSASRDALGTLNVAGVADPAVDRLIDLALASESQEELTVRVRALDRVLRAMHLWVPNWNKASHNIAFWDVFGRPEIKPPFDRGVSYWWWDEAKADALREAGALR